MIFCLAQSSHQLYENELDIRVLNSTNFDDAVTNSTDIWIVKFYTPRCRHSISLVSEFQKLAARLRKKFRFGAIDCLSEKILCRDYDVSSYPRVTFLYKSYIIDYSGPPNVESMVKAARNAKNDYREFKKIKGLH